MFHGRNPNTHAQTEISQALKMQIRLLRWHHKQADTFPYRSSLPLHTWYYFPRHGFPVWHFIRFSLSFFLGPSGSMWSTLSSKCRWGRVVEFCLVTDERFGVEARGKMGDSVFVFPQSNKGPFDPAGSRLSESRIDTRLHPSRFFPFALFHHSQCLVHLQTNSQGPRCVCTATQSPINSSCCYHGDGVSHSCVGSRVTVHGRCPVGLNSTPVIQTLWKVTYANHPA